MLGFNIEMENLAVAKFEIEKNLSKYVDASPGGGVNEIKNSFLKFNVLAKNKASETSGVKNFFNLSLGCNKEKQNEKAAKINECNKFVIFSIGSRLLRYFLLVEI